ncbi:MAG: hypothetical protein ACXU9B_20700, partial [Reyranella sp.]
AGQLLQGEDHRPVVFASRQVHSNLSKCRLSNRGQIRCQEPISGRSVEENHFRFPTPLSCAIKAEERIIKA